MYVLGIYQADTENSKSCLDLLNDLQGRGLPESGLLFVVDGGSGLNKALEEKYQVHDRKNRRAVRIRCFVHKWRNGRFAGHPRIKIITEAKNIFFNNEPDWVAELLDRRRHTQSEELEKLGTFSAVVRDVLLSFGKKNAANTRLQKLTGSVDLTSQTH